MVQYLFGSFHRIIILLLLGVVGFTFLGGCGYKGHITWNDDNKTIQSRQDLKIVEINGSIKVK
ncbi:MAG: hypothetical protein C6I01_05565 [Epsilonproteobacteria bacterium]|nr:hypothetical protein [Campylobacterota bacterium]NPA89229.1 hypothetical protein [Campylobacterota bacterium]